jgi:hypothetical protein
VPYKDLRKVHSSSDSISLKKLRRMWQVGQAKRMATWEINNREAMYAQRNIEARSRIHICRGKAISTAHSSVCLQPCFFSTQSFCAVWYCHLWPVWLYHISPLYLINGTIFGKTLNIKYVFWFSLQILSEIFFHSKKTKGIFINLQSSSCKVSTVLVRF